MGGEMGRFLVVNTVKNEGAFLLEWLAWNRIIGFTDFMIFQNDSVDGSKELLNVLHQNGFITFVDNDNARFASPQKYSYGLAGKSEAFSKADWVLAIDIDEFPVISVGDGTISALVSAYPDDADEIRLNWRNFGNGDHIEMSRDLVVEKFRTCLPEESQRDRRFPTKTLFRPKSFSRLGPHKPKAALKEVWNAYDGSGNPIIDPANVGVGLMDPDGQKLASVYHYIVKDISNFVLKCDRGKSGHANREMKARYWRHWNAQAKGGIDETLVRHAEQIREEISCIDDACGGLPLKLQEQAYAWREKRFSELMEETEYAEMLSEICTHENLDVPAHMLPRSKLEPIVKEPIVKEPVGDVVEEPPKRGPNLDFSLMYKLAKEEDGEIHETESYVVVHLPGKDRLLCGFDNLSSIKSEGPRKPWAFDIARSRGWGVLGVMVKKNDWFQSPDLYPVLEDMRDRGIFSSYENVTMYGSSMGAFGAAVFAPLSPGCTVVAFGPQSSLAADLAPFETRYRFAKKNTDWSTGRYRDAAQGVRSAGKAYLVHDPLVEPDRKHVERMLGDNTVNLSWAFLTHKIPPAFRRMNILKPMAQEMIEGSMTHERFCDLLRERRNSIAYLVRMLDGAVDRGHYRLGLAALSKIRETKDNWRLRQVGRRLRQKMRQSEADDSSKQPPVAQDSL